MRRRASRPTCGDHAEQQAYRYRSKRLVKLHRIPALLFSRRTAPGGTTIALKMRIEFASILTACPAPFSSWAPNPCEWSSGQWSAQAIDPSAGGFVFVGVKGGQPRRSNFSKPWPERWAKPGLPATLHVHDLRHTGKYARSETGASLGEADEPDGAPVDPRRQDLPARSGGAGQRIAASIDKMARQELRRSATSRTSRDRSGSGTQRTRHHADGS